MTFDIPLLPRFSHSHFTAGVVVNSPHVAFNTLILRVTSASALLPDWLIVTIANLLA